MEFLHTMVRVTDIDASLAFYCDGLGLQELRRIDNEAGRFTLIFLASAADCSRHSGKKDGLVAGLPMLELTHNWDEQTYEAGRNFGHLAYQVDDIYQLCAHLQQQGIVINRPPRDGHMAFVCSPDGISVELLQKGPALAPAEPWANMQNTGSW
ncbi:Lactoylglutathione lyase [hydrothermal vent metagenome]|uniref:Lactoylglutathione lyase n=1 Tax=hydrothermal vent metagenome TaxID=652676 RepID=A0A3B0S1Y5_9ZZZZ